LFASGPFIQSNGTLTFTPTSNANGTATVRVYLTDNGGGNYTSTVQTFTITFETVLLALSMIDLRLQREEILLSNKVSQKKFPIGQQIYLQDRLMNHRSN